MAMNYTAEGPIGGVAFLAHAASQQVNIVVNGSVTIAFGTEIFDVGTNFASNTFTAPVAGKYLLSGAPYWHNPDSAANYIQIYMVTSNRSWYQIYALNQLTGDPLYWGQSITVVTDMDASDTAYMAVYQSVGTAQMDTDTTSYFSGCLVA